MVAGKRVMWEKAVRGMKAKGYPAIAILAGMIGLLAGGWLLVHRGLLTNPVLDPDSLPPSQPEVTTVPTQPPIASPTPAPPPSPAVVETPLASEAESTETTVVRQGALRVSNPTEHPVRVALLPRKASGIAAKSVSASDRYDLPAHWDFAPQEGSARGLIVSLPNQNLELKSGDVLVAFAQDGSRRYWGPFVVGETSVPLWNAKVREWELTLEQ